MFLKKLSRLRFARFMAGHKSCIVAMEACARADLWPRELPVRGDNVRLTARRFVRPFIKRQKNDSVDAEAIVEAVQRPTMRYVKPKARSVFWTAAQDLQREKAAEILSFRHARDGEV